MNQPSPPWWECYVVRLRAIPSLYLRQSVRTENEEWGPYQEAAFYVSREAAERIMDWEYARFIARVIRVADLPEMAETMKWLQKLGHAA